MAQFVSISTFRARHAALLKEKRGVYSGVTEEICLAFKDATIEQIRHNRDMILLSNEAVVIKLRLPDKKQRLSKADGYRLIYLVLKQLPVVVLPDIYPKRGPSQQLDIDNNEINRLIQEFYAELIAGTLVEHDINNHLKEKPKGNTLLPSYILHQNLSTIIHQPIPAIILSILAIIPRILAKI